MGLSKMIVSVLTSGMFLLTGAAQAQDTWFVDDDGAGGNGCTTWVDACPDLQTALGLADSGDQMWVAAGTYKPDGGDGDRSTSERRNTGRLCPTSDHQSRRPPGQQHRFVTESISLRRTSP